MVLRAPVRPGKNGPQQQSARCVGLVVRVSTDRQAMTEEGSLKNQLQRLRQYIEYKVTACGEEWREVEVYELRAISGKDSLRSPEFQRLFADIRSGRVNTILCTALDRISRSVKDFLHFFEVINDHGVEFVCLKQNYDTTTPQGRLFVTMMMALAEFEREQTSERNREATAARAERGLWNGGRLLGYDLDPVRKGNLIPNPEEVVLVNFAFDTYLSSGSIAETTIGLNRRGYRTKAYTSRREKVHPGAEFRTASVQYLLKNPAYIGKKEVNKKTKGRETVAGGRGYRLVDAVWPGIVDDEKFEKAQRLMAANSRSNHNGSRPIRQSYVLNGGLLHCGRCGASMEGRSGTGRLGVRYYYYVCRGADCGLRVAANEIEGAVLNRIQELTTNVALLERLTEETNLRMARQKPALSAKRRSLQKSLDRVKAQADKVLAEWATLEQETGRVFLTDKLAELAQHRNDLERGLAEVDQALKQVEREQVTADTVRSALGEFSEVYACLMPFERKELIRLVLRRAEIGDRQIVLELNSVQSSTMTMAQSHLRSEPPNWLPGQDSNLQPSG